MTLRIRRAAFPPKINLLLTKEEGGDVEARSGECWYVLGSAYVWWCGAAGGIRDGGVGRGEFPPPKKMSTRNVSDADKTHFSE